MESCDPCKFRAQEMGAVKYCVMCQEAQCKTCYDVHKSSKATRAHLFMNIQDFNKDSKIVSDLVSFQRCSSHNKELRFFCADHSHLLCSTCLLGAKATGCISVAEISSVGDSLLENKFDDQLNSDLESVIFQCLKDENEIQNLMQSTIYEREDMKILFCDIKRRVTLQLDRLERDILDKVDKNVEAELTGLKQHLDYCKDILKLAVDNRAKLRTVKQNGSEADIFRCMLSITTQLRNLKSANRVKETNVYKHSLKVSTTFCSLLNDTYPVLQCNILTTVMQPPQFLSVTDRNIRLSKAAKEVATGGRKVSLTDFTLSSADVEDKTKDSATADSKETNIAQKKDLQQPKEEIAASKEMETAEVTCENLFPCDDQQSNTGPANPVKDKCSQTATKPVHVSNIRLFTPDGKQPVIEGVTTLYDGRIIFSDRSGSRLIVLNENFTYSHELSLAEAPGNLTAITPDSLALCLPVSNRVAIISVGTTKMVMKGVFETLHSPRGIYAIDKNRIFVSMTNGKMEWFLKVLTPKGAAIVTIKNTTVLDAANISSLRLRNNFRHYLLCCKRSGFLYSLQVDGNVLFKYKMESPNGMCIDDTGLIYVVDSTGTLHILTPQGELLQKITVPKGSNRITFNPRMDRLVITSQTQPESFVYTVTRERAREHPST